MYSTYHLASVTYSLETPNTIRIMISQHIVDQCVQYCTEINFKPFSKSSMFRILSACTATVRKSLHGLDYIAAEGAKAFDDLISILERLGDNGIVQNMDWTLDWIQNWTKKYKFFLIKTTTKNIN